MVKLGSKITELRTARKMSMRELAEKLDVSHAHVSKLESDKNLPSLTLLQSLANLFDVDIRYFFDIEDKGEIAPGIRVSIDKNEKDGLNEEDIQKAIEFVRDLKNGKFDLEKLNDIEL